MYERVSDRPLPFAKFLWRVVKHAACILALLLLSILCGAAGFMVFEGHGFEDAVLHSTYILSGLGLVERPASYGGKLFAGFFGLYASLLFLAAFSVIFAPVVHRILHKMNLDDDQDG